LPVQYGAGHRRHTHQRRPGLQARNGSGRDPPRRGPRPRRSHGAGARAVPDARHLRSAAGMTDSAPPYPDELEIAPLGRPPRTTVRVPGSKSITNRALVLAALTVRDERPCVLRGALFSEDTNVMIECLRTLGFRVEAWPGLAQIELWGKRGTGSRLIPADRAELFVANSGTTMRF